MTPSVDQSAAFDGQVQDPPALANTDDTFPEVNTPAWDIMNRRRCDLIRKDIREGLTPEERVEYEGLQSRTMAALEKAFPAPTKFDEELARIEAKIAAKDARGE